MLWPWPPPSRGEMLAILIGVVLLVIVFVAFAKFPIHGRWPAAGFGPEWDCATDVPYGGCIKKIAPPLR